MEDVPPGFRFYPTEEELISFYLRHKLQSTRPDLDRVIPVIDIYTHEPWELPRLAGESCRGENEEQWFFFMPQQEREARGGKPNRTTATGYWKATGSPGFVFSMTQRIGVKKTMVFYKGRAPLGKKTHWKMNEYKAIHFSPPPPPQLPSSSDSLHIPKLMNEMSLCRVYITSGSSRAFDRRPSRPIPIEDATVQLHRQPLHIVDHQLTTTTTTTAATNESNMNAGVEIMEKSISTDSSGSGGGGKIDQINGGASSSSNMNVDDDQEMMISDLQPLWDWDSIWPYLN